MVASMIEIEINSMIMIKPLYWNGELLKRKKKFLKLRNLHQRNYELIKIAMEQRMCLLLSPFHIIYRLYQNLTINNHPFCIQKLD